MKTIRVFLSLVLLILTASAFAQDDKPLPTIADKTAKFHKLPGYFNLYWDDRHGKLWLEIDRWDTEFLFLDSLPAGIGSNDIGLDRGQLGDGRVVKFQRIGPKVLLTEVNYGFRASSQNPAERRAVEDAFAQSVLWGGEVAAEEDGHALVDATSFFLADAHHVADTLKRTKQGGFKLDPARSAIYLANTKNFPDNTEVESMLTFAGDAPGKFVTEVTPDPKSITVREHYSLVKLPDNNYHPRAFDPRSGFMDIDYMDFSAPPGADVTQRFIIRHRLQKKDPTSAISEPVKPIIYYLDPGTPESIRSALLEGASWWNQAFEAAGFKNAFRVEMLPAGADPMDVRYNVIEWVHRSTRGWSYGASVVDPRTGEIIQGRVLLGSLRFRQDYMILEGLLSPYAKGKPTDPRILATVLARLRQLAAHEVGHTLGLMHNYISSAQGRTSVMDYPHPLVKLAADGSLDLSQAYATGIGEWDKVTIQYGYSEFAPGTDEHAALNDILQNALARGLSFLSDQDARPTGSAHPQVHLWDNGKDAVDELDRVLAVRANALNRFSENAIQEGRSMATLGDVLVPVYLYHRYQTVAAAKVIGGLSYTYAVRGDGEVPTTPVPAAEQRRALAAVLKTISPQTLDIPDRIANMITPHPAGIPATRESFPSRTGLTFDPLGAAESAAHNTVTLLLDPQRAARLVQHHAMDPAQLGFGEVLDALINATWKSKPATPRAAAVQRTVDDVVLTELLALVQNDKAAPEVRAMASLKLSSLGAWASSQAVSATDDQQRAHLLAAARMIHNYEQQPQLIKPTEPLAAPPGQPIGSSDNDEE